MAIGSKIRVYCGECKRPTNHVVIAERSVDPHPLEIEKWGENHYFCQCAGCDSYAYAISEWDEGDWNPHIGEMDFRWRTYPKSKTQRQTFDGDYLLPPKIRSIYSEIVGAMNAQLPLLTAIGLRALIEAICKERGVKGSNLEKLIDGLASNGILSNDQAAILHGHRFLGNVAAHEVEVARPPELVAALEIAEAMLKTIYVLPELSNQITTGRKP